MHRLRRLKAYDNWRKAKKMTWSLFRAFTLVRNVLNNYYVKCSNLSWRSSLIYSSQGTFITGEFQSKMATYGQNAKIEKLDLSLNTYVQYVKDFKFWVMAARNANWIPEKEIVKMFVSGLKLNIFRKSIPTHLRPYWM